MEVKNHKCAENDSWIATAKAANGGIPIETVEWPDQRRELEHRRKDSNKKYETLVLWMSSEDAQTRLIQDGLLFGAL
jgi:hypothetical protein